jgi:hypothetical protein
MLRRSRRALSIQFSKSKNFQEHNARDCTHID